MLRGNEALAVTDEAARDARNEQRLAKRPRLTYGRNHNVIAFSLKDFDSDEMTDLVLGLIGSLPFAAQRELITEAQFYLLKPDGLPPIARAIVLEMGRGLRLDS